MKTEKQAVTMVVNHNQENTTMSKNSERVKKYYAESCTEFKIRQPKADAQAVKDYAVEHGCSVQTLFLAAVTEYMAQDKTPSAVKRGRKPKATHPVETKREEKDK